jgi:rSAM/selenodomain-associated transferase 2
VIVSDGGSEDKTVDLAKRNGATTVAASPGRGIQLNKGAGLARGRTLLFLHADSIITQEGIFRIIKIMDTGKCVGGAFFLSLDGDGVLMEWIVRAANLRSRFLKIVYGDQGIFVDRKQYNKLNGFEEIPLMEDYDFSRRLWRSGKAVLIKKGLVASSRRWKKEGILYTTLRNWAVFSLYRLGVPPSNLKKWYEDVR